MKNIPNSVKYAPPVGYYNRTSGRTSQILAQAFDYLAPDAQLALDLGCGAGGDSEQMASHGLHVTAVDGNIEARGFINKLPHKQSIDFVHSDFENFEFKIYDIINASHSLPFTHKNVFDQVFTRLKASLRPGGIFAGRLYGVHDEWNMPGETMTFVDKARVDKLLKDLEVIKLVERQEEGSIADGKPHHWHVFDVIVRKQLKK